MLTRQDILDEYNVDEYGLIKGPDKFEAEMLYAPVYYDYYMNGDPGEECSIKVIEYNIYDVSEDERKEFPELGDVKRIAMYISESGFVSVETDPILSDCLDDTEDDWDSYEKYDAEPNYTEGDESVTE